MQIGLIGLGKMGFNLALNMRDKGHTVVATDVDAALLAQATEAGITATTSIATLCKNLSAPRVIWLMVPAGAIVDQVLGELIPALSPGDTVVDGGNSFYKDSIRRYQQCKEAQLHYLDCGTSGGTSGAREGACTMIGGDADVYAQLAPLFNDVSIANGSLYVGEAGSGHFIKMVHNGIEYGMMQSIAEGFELMQRSDFNINYEAVANLFNHGSVIRGWLMELTQNAFHKDAELSGLKGIMHSSGEGKWTLETALDMGVATPVIALSVLMRYRSQVENTFSGKVVAALRNEFGGHAVEKADS